MHEGKNILLKQLNLLSEAKMNKKLLKILTISSCAEDSSYFEPFSALSSEYLVHFIRLMEAYQAAKEAK